MALESVTYISDLVATNPTATDLKSEGDDHIRNIKAGIKNTFPNVSGAVTPTHTQLNYVTGVTSAIQTQLDSKVGAASPALTGTPTAPTAAVGTNTTQIATTAFTQAALATMPSGTLPSITGKSLQGLRVNAGETGVEWAALASTINSLTAASGASTLNNSENAIVWNWNGSTASRTGFTIGENAASTGGAGSQVLFKVATAASSTADPFQVQARGNDAIRVASDGAITLGNTGTSTHTITIRTPGSSVASTGNVTVRVGDVALGSFVAGILTLQGGSSRTTQSGNSGGVVINGGDSGNVASVAGGPIVLTAGAGSTNTTGGVGGAVTITAGAGGLAAAGGALTLAGGAGGATGSGGAVSISAGARGSTGAGSNVSITASNGSSGVGGDITLTVGTGTTNGAVNFVNTNVANGSVATTLTSLGPTGASTTVVGWLKIKVGGTTQYIPYW